MLDLLKFGLDVAKFAHTVKQANQQVQAVKQEIQTINQAKAAYPDDFPVYEKLHTQFATRMIDINQDPERLSLTSTNRGIGSKRFFLLAQVNPLYKMISLSHLMNAVLPSIGVVSVASQAHMQLLAQINDRLHVGRIIAMPSLLEDNTYQYTATDGQTGIPLMYQIILFYGDSRSVSDGLISNMFDQVINADEYLAPALSTLQKGTQPEGVLKRLFPVPVSESAFSSQVDPIFAYFQELSNSSSRLQGKLLAGTKTIEIPTSTKNGISKSFHIGVKAPSWVTVEVFFDHKIPSQRLSYVEGFAQLMNSEFPVQFGLFQVHQQSKKVYLRMSFNALKHESDVNSTLVRNLVSWAGIYSDIVFWGTKAVADHGLDPDDVTKLLIIAYKQFSITDMFARLPDPASLVARSQSIVNAEAPSSHSVAKSASEPIATADPVETRQAQWETAIPDRHAVELPVEHDQRQALASFSSAQKTRSRRTEEIREKISAEKERIKKTHETMVAEHKASMEKVQRIQDYANSLVKDQVGFDPYVIEPDLSIDLPGKPTQAFDESKKLTEETREKLESSVRAWQSYRNDKQMRTNMIMAGVGISIVVLLIIGILIIKLAANVSTTAWEWLSTQVAALDLGSKLPDISSTGSSDTASGSESVQATNTQSTSTLVSYLPYILLGLGGLLSVGAAIGLFRMRKQPVKAFEAQMAQFCGYCGGRIPSNSLFCPVCGKKRVG